MSQTGVSTRRRSHRQDRVSVERRRPLPARSRL